MCCAHINQVLTSVWVVAAEIPSSFAVRDIPSWNLSVLNRKPLMFSLEIYSTSVIICKKSYICSISLKDVCTN